MSSSEQDISDNNSAFDSFASNSGLSPPFQQVPQLNCGAEPKLEILIQPQAQFRFRYESDNKKGDHGCINGVHDDDENDTTKTRKKVYPTVRLVNHNGRATIKCELIQKNSEEQHPYKITSNNNKHQSIAFVPNKNKEYIASFKKLKILILKKGEVYEHLREKNSEFLSGFHDTKVDSIVKEMAESIDLDVVRLKFTAIDSESKEVLCSAISNCINNNKSAKTNELKICRCSKVSGRAVGKEDVYLFVEKVDKTKIQVRFYEIDENDIECWEAFGREVDVHRQYAIFFTTPPYKHNNITKNVKVFMELQRKNNDGSISKSNRIPFTYRANPAFVNRERSTNNYYKYTTNSYSKYGNEFQQVEPANSFVQIDLPSSAFEAACPLVNSEFNPQNIDNSSFTQLDTQVTDTEINRDNNLYVTYGIPQQPSENISILPDYNNAENQGDTRNLLRGDPLWAQNHTVNYFDPKEIMRHYNITPTDSSELDSSILTPMDIDDLYLRDPLNDQGISNNWEADSCRVKDKVKIKKEIKEENVGENSSHDKISEEHNNFKIKKLVKEILSFLKSESEDRTLVQGKLEQLIVSRLANGETYLHNLLDKNTKMFVWMVRLICSFELPHLLCVTDERQQTVLHRAANLNLPDIVAFLVEVGCDPMLEDHEGNNALHFAAMQCSDGCLMTLLEITEKHQIKIDLEAYNFEKRTPLHLAALYSTSKSVVALLSRGAVACAGDAAGRTPLHLAVCWQRLHVCKTLLKFTNESNIDAVDVRGLTALQYACDVTVTSEDTLAIIRLLLENEANPLNSENGTKSPLELARKRPQVWKVFKNFEKSMNKHTESDEEYFSAGEEVDSIMNVAQNDSPKPY